MIYLGIFVLTVLAVGAVATIVGNPFTPQTVFIIMGILGAEIIVAIILFENQMSFMDLSRIPNIKTEPVEDTANVIREYIFNKLNEKIDFKTIIESLQRTGYTIIQIEEVVRSMEASGELKFNKPKEEAQEKKKLKKRKVSKK